MKLHSFGCRNVPFYRGDELYANDPAGLSSNPRISFHICQKKLHMLFSELNDSKEKVFSKSLTYAAEFNIAVPFNNQIF